jgi:hypothetical protein
LAWEYVATQSSYYGNRGVVVDWKGRVFVADQGHAPVVMLD